MCGSQSIHVGFWLTVGTFSISFAYTVDTNTIGENIIATTKIRNNYATIQSLFFQYCDSNIGLFSIASFKFITLISLHPFWYQFFAFFDGFLSKVIALPTIAICRSFSLIKVIAIRRLPLLFANAFKIVKGRQLLL